MRQSQPVLASCALACLSLLACQSGAPKAQEPRAATMQDEPPVAEATLDSEPPAAKEEAPTPCQLQEEYLDESLEFSLEVGGPAFATLYGGISVEEHQKQLNACEEEMSDEEKASGKHHCLAKVVGARVKLIIPEDYPNVPASLVAHRSGVTLRASLGAKGLRLHAGRLATLGGFLVPDDRFSLPGRTGNMFRVQLPLPPIFVEPQTLTRNAQCDDLSINGGGRNTSSLLEHLGTASDERLVFAEDQPIPLLQSPGGVKVALLDLGRGDVKWLHAHRREDGFTQVSFDTDVGTAFGWVENTMLRTDETEFGYGGLGLSGIGRGGGGAASLRQCEETLTLWGERNERRQEIGDVQPHVTIRLASRDGDFTQIDFPDQGWFVTQWGSKLLLRTSDLATCEPVER